MKLPIYILLTAIPVIGWWALQREKVETEDASNGQVSEKTKAVVVEKARAIFAKGHFNLPLNSVPKVEYDPEGHVTVEFMHVQPLEIGVRRGDNLGFVRFDPATLQPIEILGPGP